MGTVFFASDEGCVWPRIPLSQPRSPELLPSQLRVSVSKVLELSLVTVPLP